MTTSGPEPRSGSNENSQPANALETLRASRMNEETTASGKSCSSRSSGFLILLLMLDLGSFRAFAAAVRLFNSTALIRHSISLRWRIFAFRKIVEKHIDRSNATVPGDDKIGSCVSWWFAGCARYPSNPAGIT